MYELENKLLKLIQEINQEIDSLETRQSLIGVVEAQFDTKIKVLNKIKQIMYKTIEDEFRPNQDKD